MRSYMAFILHATYYNGRVVAKWSARSSKRTRRWFGDQRVPT